MNVRINACNTNIENVRVSRIPACNPTFKTISSTRPLQDIREPIAPDSRQLKPKKYAVIEHPRNLEKNAMAQMRKT